MAVVIPDASFNKIIHSATLQKLIRNGLKGHSKEFFVLTWPPNPLHLNAIKHLYCDLSIWTYKTDRTVSNIEVLWVPRLMGQPFHRCARITNVWHFHFCWFRSFYAQYSLCWLFHLFRDNQYNSLHFVNIISFLNLHIHIHRVHRLHE